MMAALRLGVERAVGIDLDPCALAEAAGNAALNGLGHRVSIGGRDLDLMRGEYAMVTANLRYPTLLRLADRIAGRLAPGGRLVLSGIKVEECEDARKSYESRGLKTLWTGSEKGWAALLFRATGS